MNIELFNTMTRKKETLKPLKPEIRLYTCGHTVYSEPHIGNWSIYVYWDLLVRTLGADGHSVNHVQNITDVGHLTDDEDQGEDKLQKAANTERKTAWEVAEQYSRRVKSGEQLLGLLKPTHSPKATEYIEGQIDLVKQLQKLGYTYAVKDDGVYFDTSKLTDYGKLARLDIEGLEAGARVAVGGKKNPTDFALWKLTPRGVKRDMEWDSPWGKGFPGWHLECSVMAMQLLGDQIDIHTGGIDHIAVHHTNEIAQTETITGKPFSSIWLHANHMKVNGKKMSKSLGNIYTLDDLVEKGYDLQAYRLLVLTSHYRTQSNFTWKLLNAAQSRLKRWQSVSDLRWQTKDKAETINKIIDEALNSADKTLNDDLDTPKALSHLEEVFNVLEKQPLASEDIEAFDKFINFIDKRLGVNLYKNDIDTRLKKLIVKRQKSRDGKDFSTSDELRDALLKKGIAVRDTEYGSIWSRA